MKLQAKMTSAISTITLVILAALAALFIASLTLF